MKIALICTEKLPVPPISGGAIQLYIEGVVPYLSQNHDITVFSITHPDLLEEEIIENVKYIRSPGKSVTQYLDNLKEKIKDFDLIHVFNRPLWVLELSKNLPNVKFSLSLHNEMFHPKKISAEKAVECINKVEFISTVSKFIANGVKKLYPEAENKLKVIYSGTDSAIYFPPWTDEGVENKKLLKEKYDIENYKVVLFVGRLSVKKGVHVLLRAMKEVMDCRDDVALVVVGSKWYGENKQDEYTSFIQNIAEELNGPIVFTGFLPPIDIPKHYNLGDVFVCPSQWREPLARVHYEAMAAGLPIITTNRGGNSEVIRGYDNGIVIDKYNEPKEFQDNIIDLLNNPSRAIQMGMNGRNLAEEKYNWKRVADDLLDKFNSIN